MKEQPHRALVLYWSHGGNTKKVAERIHATLGGQGITSELVEITPELRVDYLDYRLVFVGAPVYQFLPPKPVMAFLNGNWNRERVRGGAPERPGHWVVVFCTYGGGHTGFREALPALKYMGQFFEHEGIRVVDEWGFVGDFPDAGADYTEHGRLGSIAGRPTEEDLEHAAGQVGGLIKRLSLLLET